MKLAGLSRLATIGCPPLTRSVACTAKHFPGSMSISYTMNVCSECQMCYDWLLTFRIKDW